MHIQSIWLKRFLIHHENRMARMKNTIDVEMSIAVECHSEFFICIDRFRSGHTVTKGTGKLVASVCTVGLWAHGTAR